jgi:hypothetical protein
MNSIEFREIAIKSAKKYFEYLENEGLGVELIKISNIKALDNCWLLKLQSKLFDPDNIQFRIGANLYNTTQIYIAEYDRDENNLIVKPKEEYCEIFDSINPKDIILISDLKFLVKRVQTWYEQYGERININKSFHKNINIYYTEHKQLSDEQLNAVQHVLSDPLTYVWGAPGTGKTRFVLSFSILSCIKYGQRVAVFAPTNNALEQVLFGIMEFLQEAEIETSKVLRLGTPSRKFALKYPEACEIAGINKRLRELTDQCAYLKKVLTYRKFRDFYHSICEPLRLLINKGQNLYEEFQNSQRNQKKIQDDMANKELKLKASHARLNMLEEQRSLHIEKSKKLSFKIRSSLNDKFKQTSIIEIGSLSREIDETNKEIIRIQNEINNLQSLSKTRISETIDLKNQINDMIRNICLLVSPNEKLSEIVRTLNIYNLPKILEKIETKISEGEQYCTKHDEEYSDYDKESQEEITEKISNLQHEIEIAEALTTEKRLNEAKVIAATVDGYIAKFGFNSGDTESCSLNVDHIFLDEAGYCSLIKGMTLLASPCPVTLLGDHMQLPPVCELNDDKIGLPVYSKVFLWAQSTIYMDEAFIYPFETIYQNYLSGAEATFPEIKRCDLTVTYRFGMNLASVLDQFVYQNGFSSAYSENDIKIYVLDAKRHADPKKRMNSAEVEAIQDILTNLTDDYVILSPYRNQVDYLREKIPEAGRDMRILTVHKSQGREWDTVILSVTDTSDRWFTNSTNIISHGKQVINTAVSRAKRELILVCDMEYWLGQEEQLIGKLVQVGLNGNNADST